jgi:glycosyltransferase involved in cell wall biosynthesis
MNPQVSVILPVYNQEKYLEQTIESILSQTYTNFELLLLDDGSKDKSAEVIRKYSEKDKRIKAFYQENTGKCTATNKLVEIAKGDYCAFLDADDVMLPNRLERQINYHLNNPKVDATSCHCYYINEKGKQLGKQHFPGLENPKDSIKAIKNNKIVHCAFTGLMMTKKSFLDLDGLRPAYWPCEDFDIVNRLIEKGYKLVIIQDVLMCYRVHSSSITVKNPMEVLVKSNWTVHNTLLRRGGYDESTFERYKEELKNEPFIKKWNRIRTNYANIYFKRAGVYLMSKKYLKFITQITAASLLSPAYVTRKFYNLAKPVTKEA